MMDTNFQPFPVTRWTVVDQAANISSEAGFNALEELLIRYRPALKAHLVFVKKIGSQQADDLIQSFIAGKILQGEIIARADREKGRFRTFLLTAFNRFVADEFAKEYARKRSPDGGFVALDEALDASKEDPHASSSYDLAWVREIIQETIESVQLECRHGGKEHYWVIFEARIIEPILNGQKAPNYEELLERVPLDNPMQASNALITVKRMFVRTIRKVIGRYADDEGSIQQELDELRQILAEFC